MVDVIFYSVVEVLSGLAPSYGWFLFLRALYGIGMGGEWGVGASLAMEAVAPRWRGFFSGLLQEGYAVGYLLAAAAFFFVFPHFGWRAMFFLGGAPALLTIYIRAKVPESEAWQRTRPDRGAISAAIRANWKLFLYLCVLMTMMNFVSHGTQDMYPTFLEKTRGFDTRTVATIAIIYNVGALLGGLTFGYLSDRWGRRRTMATAVICAGLVIPLWIYPSTLARADARRVPDAVHGAGRMGRNPGASDRAVAARSARTVLGPRVSNRRPAWLPERPSARPCSPNDSATPRRWRASPQS